MNTGPGSDASWGAYASTRVVFGVSPNRVFRRDAGKCTRDAAGRVRSPDRPEFTQAKARIGGRLDRRLADEGNLAKAGSTRSTLCTTIVPSKLQPIGRLARP